MESRDNVKENKNSIKDNIIIGYIFEFLKQNKLWVIVTLLIVFITNPLEMIVLSDLFGNFTSTIGKMDYENSIKILWKIVGLYILIDTMNILAISYLDKKYYPMLEKFVRFKIFDVIFKNIEVNYDNENISNTILQLLQIPNIVTTTTQTFIYWILTFVITIVSILFYISYINLQIGAISIVTIFVFVIYFYYILKQIKQYSCDRANEEKILMTHADDILSNSLSILACRKINDEKKYLDKCHIIYDKKFENQLWYSSKGAYIFSIIVAVILVIFIYLILAFYKNKKISSKDTLKLTIIVLFFIRYIKSSITRIIHIVLGHGRLEDMEKSIKEILTNTKNTGFRSNIPVTGNIEFKNVSFEYNKKNTNNQNTNEYVKALDNVSFKIKPLDRVAFVGTNGSGKSTIIKLIMGYYNVSKGEVLHNGVNVSEINREYLRSKITIINQNIILFNRSIIDNICYGNNIPKEKVIQILKKIHIMRVFKNQPNGLETLAGLHGSNLSGGQKQIIHLLRSYLSNKPIIIMDEPTASIDNIHKKYIIRMINEMSKKSTLIIVTHDEEYAASFPTKIYMEDGKIIKIKGENDSMMPYDNYDNFLH
jgi:ABC-type bacteriocin/lantibiotic exporter with double-glycine peptidase domain